MSFSFKSFQGESADYRADEVYAIGHERETNILAVVKQAVEEIVSAVGGHVAVSASGHINEYDDTPGDSLNIQVTSFLRPSDPTPDAGLEAAAGSPRNFPPEASTAAPATEDQSPPATQESNPQPLVETVGSTDAEVEESAPDEQETTISPVADPVVSESEEVVEAEPDVQEPALDPEAATDVPAAPADTEAQDAPDPTPPAESAGPTESSQSIS